VGSEAGTRHEAAHRRHCSGAGRPDEVQIKEVIGEHAHVLELRVAKDDLGKVIGKHGAHASAIRTLMAAASGKETTRYILEIIVYYPPLAFRRAVRVRNWRLRSSTRRDFATSPAEARFPSVDRAVAAGLCRSRIVRHGACDPTPGP
jgi:predicted RNA-binding protein YlqC (UPF0109 family)